MSTQPDVATAGKRRAVGFQGSIISTHKLRNVLSLRADVAEVPFNHFYLSSLQTDAMGFQPHMWSFTSTRQMGKTFVCGDSKLQEQEALKKQLFLCYTSL